MDFWNDYLENQGKANIQLNADHNSPCPAAGQPCPHCGSGQLEYDGKLNLICPLCGFESASGFT